MSLMMLKYIISTEVKCLLALVQIIDTKELAGAI